VHAAPTWTGTPSSPPVAPPRRSGADQAPPHPLDHATYEFPPASADPYPYARFAGHLPALRLPPPRHGGLLTRCTARQALVAWSVVDLWAFATALRLGPTPLAALALAGMVATCWHLRTLSRRRTQVSRTTNALSPALADLAPLGASARRGHRGRGRLHTTFSPRTVHRRRRAVVGTRRPSDWWPAGLSPSMFVAAASVVAGVVVHAALSGAGPLH
jgi:hypothetical protein